MARTSLVARDIMTTRVITLSPDQDLFEVIGLLVKHKISGAPVVDKHGRYLGIFSERSSISLLMEAVYEGTPTNRIEGFIDRDAPTISPDTDLLTIAQTLMHTHYRRLTVVQFGRVVGLVSRRDVLRAAHALAEFTSPSDSAVLYLSVTRERNEAPIG